MKLLAVDSSSLAASCALSVEGALVGESYIRNQMTHSQTLMPMIGELLARTGYALSGLDGLAVTVGPGSFTGLRIGISAVKGMGLGADKPCVAVSTLEALAYNLSVREGLVCAAMDARRRQVYAALFSCEGGRVRRLWEDRALAVEELAGELDGLAAPVMLVGDGAVLCRDALGRRAGHTLAPEGLRHQRAASVCAAALAALEADPGRFVPCDALEPSYLRLPQAERELKAKETVEGGRKL